MKAANPASRTKPSVRLIMLPFKDNVPKPSMHNTNRSSEAATAKGMSLRTVERDMTIGATMAVHPTMSIVLRILLPTTLPTARSGVPFSAETRLTKSSGADVPAATIVSPINTVVQEYGLNPRYHLAYHLAIQR